MTQPLTDLDVIEQRLRGALLDAIVADGLKPPAERVGLVAAMLAVVRPELARLTAELRVSNELLTEVTAACSATEREAANLRAGNEALDTSVSELRDRLTAANATMTALRAELADTDRMRDFHARSAGHIARKRDRAEQLISRWRDGHIDAEHVLDRIARALSPEGDEAPPPPTTAPAAVSGA